MLGDVLTLVSAAAPLALMVALGVLAQISRRFGEVTRRPPVYRGFYVAMALLALPGGVRLLSSGFSDAQQDRLGGNAAGALLHDVPLLLAVLVALAITGWYWGWLLRDSEEPVATSPHQRAGKANGS